MDRAGLHELFEDAALRVPHRVALEEPAVRAGTDRRTYRELAALSDRVRDRLRHWGVVDGDRVGLYLRKSIDGVASILGTLKAGAAYVPVDPNAPVARNGYILGDCAVKVVVVERRFADAVQGELAAHGSSPRALVLDDVGGGLGLAAALDREDAADRAGESATARVGPDDRAYVLYTSGSTGRPKGVILSHRNAVSFVDWCSEVFEPRETDRFSSHAPFHFDLSILDLYVPLKHGAALVLIGEEVGKEPQGLAALIEERRISIWYSAPSILSLLTQYGELGRRDLSALRMILFAGEVFPIKHLRALKALVPTPRYFNLYGPTETNVCTFYEVPREIPDERTDPYPIGKVCSHLQTKVVSPDGSVVGAGAEGELCVSGAGVMQGYWNLPERSAEAFLVDRSGVRWYRTGDIVVEQADGNYVFVGRRDRMVKRRGYRIELGEIESGLYRHPAVREAAVIALADEESGVRIKAFLSCHEGRRPSLIELKRFCAGALPVHMIPDLFSFQPSLPKTSTDKIDYQRLKETE